MMKQTRKARTKPIINDQLNLDNNKPLESTTAIAHDCELQSVEQDNLDSKDANHIQEESDYDDVNDASHDSDEDNSQAKKNNNSSTQKHPRRGRTEKPCLGQIPEVEHKRVECQEKTGRIINDKILCDCCHKKFAIGSFEKHAGLQNARNPYKTIFLIESGKPLDYYRYCSSCHTTETPVWMEGPLGPRTLCAGCGTKFQNGTLQEVYLTSLREQSVYKECRDKGEAPARPLLEHSKNVQAVVEVDYKDFTYEHFYYHTLLRKEPVVIKNFDKLLTKDLWSWDYLLSKYGDTDLAVRYMEHDPDDESQFGVLRDDDKTIEWFVDYNHGKAEDSDDEQAATKGFDRVVYAKDFSFSECASEWKEDVVKNLPPFIVPHNKDYDLMGYIPEPARPIVWMGYIGSEGTRTPLHVDKLSSIAINLFAFGDPKPPETDEVDVVNDEVKTQGESVKLWWFIDHRDSHKLEECLQQQQGSLHKDNFWMAPSELEQLGLRTWYFEQRPGDLVIVPPLVPHTVVNRGGLSCAVAANVLNVTLVDHSWERERFNRTINRSSIYRLKPAVYFAVKTLIAEIQFMLPDNNNENNALSNNNASFQKLNIHPRQTLELTENCVDLDAKLYKLYELYDVYEGIVDEERADGECIYDQEDKYFTCDGCGAEIFNRRYHCNQCRVGDYDLCLQCTERFGKDNHYHKMVLCEKIKNQELVDLLESAKTILSNNMDRLKKRIESVPLVTKIVPVERYEKDTEVVPSLLETAAKPLPVILPKLGNGSKRKKTPSKGSSSPKRRKKQPVVDEEPEEEGTEDLQFPVSPRVRKARRTPSIEPMLTDSVETTNNNTVKTDETSPMDESPRVPARRALRTRKKMTYEDEEPENIEEELEEKSDASQLRRSGRKKQLKLDQVTVNQTNEAVSEANEKKEPTSEQPQLEKVESGPKKRGRKKKVKVDEVSVQEHNTTTHDATPKQEPTSSTNHVEATSSNDIEVDIEALDEEQQEPEQVLSNAKRKARRRPKEEDQELPEDEMEVVRELSMLKVSMRRASTPPQQISSNNNNSNSNNNNNNYTNAADKQEPRRSVRERKKTNNKDQHAFGESSDSEMESKPQRKSRRSSRIDYADLDGSSSDSNLSDRTSSDDKALDLNLPEDEVVSANGRYPSRRRTLQVAVQPSSAEKKQSYKKTTTKAKTKPLEIQEVFAGEDQLSDKETKQNKPQPSTPSEQRPTRKRKQPLRLTEDYTSAASSSSENQVDSPTSPKKSKFQLLDFTTVSEKTLSPPQATKTEPPVETVTEATETQMAPSGEMDIVRPTIAEEDSSRVPLSRRRRKPGTNS